MITSPRQELKQFREKKRERGRSIILCSGVEGWRYNCTFHLNPMSTGSPKGDWNQIAKFPFVFPHDVDAVSTNVRGGVVGGTGQHVFFGLACVNVVLGLGPELFIGNFSQNNCI